MFVDDGIDQAKYDGAALIPVLSRSLGSWHFSISRRPFKPDELRQHYDHAAHKWQSKIEKLGFGHAYGSLVSEVLASNEWESGKQPISVLDVGAGTGAMSAAFAGACTHEIDLVATDISAQMLQVADEYLKTHHSNKLAGLRLVEAPVEMLPFEDERFDVVLAAHVIEHLGDPVAAVREMYRVLKPGGLAISCITKRSTLGAYIQFAWRAHSVGSTEALAWFEKTGFENTSRIPFDRRLPAYQFSSGYSARKPMVNPAKGKHL